MIKLITDLENWHQKIKDNQFFTALNPEVLQDIKKSFEDVLSEVKIH